MLTFFSVQIELALFVGVTLAMLGYALWAGNGCSSSQYRPAKILPPSLRLIQRRPKQLGQNQSILVQPNNSHANLRKLLVKDIYAVRR